MCISKTSCTYIYIHIYLCIYLIISVYVYIYMDIYILTATQLRPHYIDGQSAVLSQYSFMSGK